MLRVLVVIAVLSWGLAPAPASAAPVAGVSAELLEAGAELTLWLEAGGRHDAPPDLTPLQSNFEVLGQQTSVVREGGAWTTRVEVRLRPREAGVLGVPSLDWAGGRTQAMGVTVVPGPAAGDDPDEVVFLEVGIGSDAAWVGQALVYTVRLGYRVALLEGRLDAPSVRGEPLQALGEDRSSDLRRGEHRYRLVERRYLLVPEAAGPLDVEPPRFTGRVQLPGRSIYSGFDTVIRSGEALRVDVGPLPANAPRPWLPASDLSLDWAGPPPESLRVGEPLTLVLRLRGEGVVPEQLPELALPPIDGVQVFAESTEFRRGMDADRPWVEARRSFTLLPLRAGMAELPAPALDWWDVAQGRLRRAEAAALGLEVLDAPATAHRADAMAGPTSGAVGPGWAWPWVSALLALGWLLTLVWWRLGSTSGEPPRVEAVRGPASRPDALRALRRALARADAQAAGEAIASLLPGSDGLGPVMQRLADPGQAQAVALLREALWGRGDRARAMAAVASAFRRPVAITDPAPGTAPDSLLPPLYPDPRT